MALRKVQSGVIADNAITSTKIASGTTVSPTQLTTEINNLIASAPGALNTLDELAAALGDDANYAATITTALSTKADSSTVNSALATKASTGNAIAMSIVFGG